MDILKLVETVVGNPGTILVVLGLVEYFRQLGLRDLPLRVSAMVVGLLFGGGAIISQSGAPVDFGGYFFVVSAGVLFGLIASGVVDLTGRLIATKVAEATEDPEKTIVENA